MKHAAEKLFATNQQRRNLIIAGVGALVLLFGIGMLAIEAFSDSSSEQKTVETGNTSSNSDDSNQRSGDPAEGSSTTRVKTGAAGNRGDKASKPDNKVKKEQPASTSRDNAANRASRETTTTQPDPDATSAPKLPSDTSTTMEPVATTTSIDSSSTTTVP